MMSHDLPSDLQKPLKEAMNHLKHQQWNNASTIFGMVLQDDPDSVAAKAGKIMVKYRISTIETIPECKQDITFKEQEILADAFEDIHPEIVSLMDNYRTKSRQNRYQKAKKEVKTCHFLPYEYAQISANYDFKSLVRSSSKIKNCQKQFKEIGDYEDSKECAELCELTHEMVTKARSFIPKSSWVRDFPLIKFFGLPSLLYVLFSWTAIICCDFQSFLSPIQTIKKFFYILFNIPESLSLLPSNAFLISTIIVTIIFSVIFALYPYIRHFLLGFELLFSLETFLVGVLFVALGVLLPLIFIVFSPIVSIIVLIIVASRILKQHLLIKNFTACNAELIQRMEVLSKQCSMLNPKRIMRELF